jgi:putative FmdB family regulatory protein
MPTYEYRCSKCEEEFEFFQKISEEPIRECPVCKGELKRVISGGAGIIFKGSGFYTTDYKNSSTVNSSGDKEKEKNDGKKEAITRDSNKHK